MLDLELHTDVHHLKEKYHHRRRKLSGWGKKKVKFRIILR